MRQPVASSQQLVVKCSNTFRFFATGYRLPATGSRGFTLIETMVAITILMIAIVAPMTMTVQALNSAYYARDQITASNLAQEGIEVIRAVRDGNVLKNAYGQNIDLLAGIPNTNGQPFRVDVQDNSMISCTGDPDGVCIPLRTNGQIFGYTDGWASSRYTRTLTACFVQASGSCTSAPSNEVHITVTVTWKTGRLQQRSFTISENLYRWVEDGSAV